MWSTCVMEFIVVADFSDPPSVEREASLGSAKPMRVRLEPEVVHESRPNCKHTIYMYTE